MSLSASILGRLQHQHETISELINGFSEDQLKYRQNPEKWSAFENIVHLAAYQPTFIDRISLILQGGQPLFERYVAENDPLFYKYLQKPLQEVLNITAGDRSFIFETMRGLTDDQLQLKGLHARYGALTIPQWADLFLLHEAHHLWTTLQLISSLRVLARE